MGREWLYWVGGGGKDGGGMGRRGGRMAGEDNSSSAGGCMRAVFQLFDLHHFQVPLNHHHHHHSDTAAHFLRQPESITSSSKGIEAPRNSLESDEAPTSQNHNSNFHVSSDIYIHAGGGIKSIFITSNYKIQGGLQIKTRVPRKSKPDELLSSECSSSSSISPGAKTPNLVARLMGLDVLPPCTSPASNSRLQTRSHFKDKHTLQRRSTGSFSDDDSAGRISLGRRSDVVDYHRLSMNEEYGEGKRRGRLRLSQDENRSPGYARQIVNQVRERVTRKFGHDITNTRNEIRRDETLIPVNSNQFRSSLPSLAEPEHVINRNHKQAANLGTKSSRISEPGHKENTTSSVSGHAAMKVEALAKFAERRQPKKVPVTSELPVKKDPSPPATKLPQKQSQEVSNALSSKRYTQLSNSAKQQPDQISTVHRATAAAEYRWYIQRILKRAGMITGFTTPLKLGQWHSPSHPLDPSTFYYLELFHPSAASGAVLGRRCNRMLIFQVVDELLAQILISQPNSAGPGDLTHELCRRIENFPAADCRVLEDIDSLVNRDAQVNAWEERAWLVGEIDGEIMEWLVQETAVEMVGGRE